VFTFLKEFVEFDEFKDAIVTAILTLIGHHWQGI